ncbi:MAG: hypothetical protein DSZ11_02220 [Sulfurovum sp.]|nr:MAG: hypothetical protein DSZ11_02220 [Sulfurovum sp.]
MKPIKPIKPISILLFLLLGAFAYSGTKESDNHKISIIEEASGISYCTDTNTYIVANDEGSFYEISPKGKIISRHKLGDFDLEGVVCQKDTLIFAVEKGALLIVDRETLESKYLKIKGLSSRKNQG